MADKIAISLDHELLERVEALRLKTGESRSAVFARAIVALVRNEERRAAVERYVEGYVEYPETDAELAEAEALSRLSLASVEWDE